MKEFISVYKFKYGSSPGKPRQELKGGTKVDPMEKHCLWISSSWLSYTVQTNLPNDVTAQNPSPLIIDKENAPIDMRTGQSDEGNSSAGVPPS